MKYKNPLKRILEGTRWYWDHDGVPQHVRTAFRKVLECRTRALGGEVFASENGELVIYHTCKSRACPSCGIWATKKWIPERVAALPPVPYKGITFSMPDVLWRMFRQNRILADALPTLAGNAIQALITARHGLCSGIIAFLHTFNGRLEFNSHVHTMVTAGGWHALSESWVQSVYFDCSLLTRLWRQSVLKLLCTALRSGLLTTDWTIDETESILAKQERWWSVNIQSLDSIAHFFEYSGRYARRPVIAERRITYLDERTVEFWAKDKRTNEIMPIRHTMQEFIDLWAQHVLKRYRHAVQYFGLFAPRAHRTLELIFRAIGCQRQPRPAPPRWADSRWRISGRNPLLDETNHRMFWVRQLAPQPLS